METDYFDLAQSATKEQFIQRCPFSFFVGADVLRRPTGPAQTIVHFDQIDPTQPRPREEGKSSAPRPLVLAIRKVQPVFPSMISIGRTNNNDVVIPDVQVSKVHAYVRQADGQLEISDAGSRNGTWVGGERLVPKGPPRVLLSGERVKFGTLEFVFFTNDVCWSRLRVWRK
jgi:hypothetical protein